MNIISFIVGAVFGVAIFTMGACIYFIVDINKKKFEREDRYFTPDFDEAAVRANSTKALITRVDPMTFEIKENIQWGNN